MLSVVLYRGMAGQFSARHHDAVEAASLYWHFVDVVWILLFSLALPPARQGSRHASAPTPAQRRSRRRSCSSSSAFVYWAVPYFGGWHVDYAGVTMLARPRRRDGAHGLRARRRLAERLSGRGRPTDR